MNKEQFKHIFDNYFDSIRRYVYYRITDENVACDIAQDVFMKVWEKRDSLKDYNIKALLYKIAADSVVSHFRKIAVRADYAQNMRLEDSDVSPHQLAEFEELKTLYAAVLEQMSDVQRITFLMSREENLKYHEIADRLGISVKTVEKRMSIALQLLKRKLL